MEILQPKNLRTGNYIFDDEGKICKVECIQSDVYHLLMTGDDGPVSFSKNDNDNFYTCQHVYGIPLTEELLLKMGFEKLPHFTITNSLILKLSRGRMITVSSVGSPNLMVWIENVEGKDITDLVCIHNWDYDGELHVHTLQNIVWLLGKKELTLS